MKIDEITSSSIKNMSNQEIFSLHKRTHQLHTLAKNRKDKKQMQLLKTKHNMLCSAIKEKGFSHKTPLRSLNEASTGSEVVRFVVHDHKADRAGYHQDLRFQLPRSRNWASYAVPKGIPTEPGIKVLSIRTHDHTEKEALFIGDIPPGDYGAGTLTIFDEGLCKLEKFTSAHIIMTFQGSKIKGIYHMVSVGNISKEKFKQRQYLLFKSKIKTYKPLNISGSEMNNIKKVYNRFKNVRI